MFADGGGDLRGETVEGERLHAGQALEQREENNDRGGRGGEARMDAAFADLHFNFRPRHRAQDGDGGREEHEIIVVVQDEVREDERGQERAGKKKFRGGMRPAANEGKDKQRNQSEAAERRTAKAPRGLRPVRGVQAVMPVAKIPEHHRGAVRPGGIEPQVNVLKNRAGLDGIGVMRPQQK